MAPIPAIMTEKFRDAANSTDAIPGLLKYTATLPIMAAIMLKTNSTKEKPTRSIILEDHFTVAAMNNTMNDAIGNRIGSNMIVSPFWCFLISLTLAESTT